MPDNITVAFVQQYKANVDLILQQKGSRLRGLVTSDQYKAKFASVVEQFGPAVATKRVTRHSDTPLNDLPQFKRWVTPVDYEWGSLIDDQDKLRMLVDPTSPYVLNGANALARAQDDEILGAFFASSSVGENGTGTEAFDTTNFQIGVNVGGTASALNVAKLQAGVKALMIANKGEIMEPIQAAISSTDHDALLKEIQVTSRDFNGTPVMEDGRVRRFMGVDFVITERVLLNASSQRRLPLWVKTGMHLGIWEDIQTKISERADKGYATQVYLRGTFGATRLQQGKVVEMVAA